MRIQFKLKARLTARTLLFAGLVFATHTNANPATGMVSRGEQISISLKRFFDSFRTKAKTEPAHVETDPKNLKGRSPTPEGNGIHKIYRADESILDDLGAVVIDAAYLAKQPAFIGREEELAEAATRLLSARKPNVLVLGEAGSGKTSMVTELARQLIYKGEELGLGKVKMIRLSVDGIVKGTTYRGELEDKIAAAIAFFDKEAAKEGQTLILYIDEIHQIMGAGKSQDGSGSIADKLKPFLSEEREGRARVIGSTTIDEGELIQKDPAFARRLGAPIYLNSPSKQLAFDMVKANLPRYESYYGVKFTDEIIALFVEKAGQFSKFILPDPALDMMDRAGASYLYARAASVEVAKIMAQIGSVTSQLNYAIRKRTAASSVDVAKFSRQLKDLEADLKKAEAEWSQKTAILKDADVGLRDGKEKLKALDKKVSDTNVELFKAREDLIKRVMNTEADDLKGIQLNQELNTHIQTLEKRLNRIAEQRLLVHGQMRETFPEITRDDAYKAIAAYTGFSVDVIRRTSPETTLLLRNQLPYQVLGQGGALKAIGRAMSAGLHGMKFKNRPKGVIIVIDSAHQFDETARAVDNLVFDANNAQEVREAKFKTTIIDFSNPDHQNFTFELIQPQHAGRPQQAVAIKNLELAPARFLHQVNSILSDGQLTSPDLANPMNFRETVLLLNFGSLPDADKVANAIYAGAKPGEEFERFMRLYREHNKDNESWVKFAEAVIPRSNGIAHLQKHNLKSLTRIVQRHFRQLNQDLKASHTLTSEIELVLSHQAARFIARKARVINNVEPAIQRFIIDRLAKFVDNSEIQGGEIINIDLKDDELIFQRISNAQ